MTREEPPGVHRAAGFTAQTFRSAEEFLGHVSVEPPAWLVLEIPTVFVTAHHVADAGVPVLSKPVDADRRVDAVTRAIRSLEIR